MDSKLFLKMIVMRQLSLTIIQKVILNFYHFIQQCKYIF